MTYSTRLALAAAAAALIACGGGGDGGVAPPTFAGFTGGAVTLQFEARAGSTRVSCGSSIDDLGSGAATARLKDLRFHIANVRLIAADGSEVPLDLLTSPVAVDLWNAKSATDSLTLIDLEDGTAECAGGTSATNAVVSGSVPGGNYVAVRMVLGVPESLNHLDPFAADTPRALSSVALGWSQTAGRIFSKIDVTDPALSTTPTWPSPVFTAHLGAQDCTGDPAAGVPATCALANRMLFTLGSESAPFDPTKHKILLDLQGLLAGNDVTTNTAGTASGCMSARDDPQCMAMFGALQIDLATGLPINEGQGQTVFRMVEQ